MENNDNVVRQVVGDPAVDPNDPGTSKPNRKQRSQAFNHLVGEGSLLAEAMAAHQEALTPKGGGEDFVNRLKEMVQAARDLNQEQERYKALQKETTGKIQDKLKEVNRMISNGHKIVKMTIDQKRWVEFGIRATR